MRFRKYLQNAGLVLAVVFAPNVAFAQTCQEKFETVVLFWPYTDLAEVSECLEAGVNLNAITNLDRTVFHLAVKEARNPLIIAALIDAGADVNVSTSNGFTPIFLSRNVDVINLLAARGADIEARTSGGSTPLIHAVSAIFSNQLNRAQSIRKVHALLKLGADVNAQNLSGETVLHVAARFSNLKRSVSSELFLLFIANGADTELTTNRASRNRAEYTALHMLLVSGARGEDEARLLLVLGADATAIIGGLNRSTAHAAICRNDRPSGYYYLGGSNMLETLLKLGADPTIVAIDSSRSAIGSAFYYECYEDIRLFRKYGYLDRQPALTYE